MRKPLLILCAVALGAPAIAQMEEGHILLSGASDLGFVTGKTDNDQDDAESTFTLDLKGGYFVIDNLNVGLGLGFSSFSQGDFSLSSFSIGPYLRYYLPMKLFGELGYQFGSQKLDVGDGDATISTGDLGIVVGYAIMCNDVVAIEPSLGYQLTSGKPDEGDSFNGSNFGINFGVTVFLGD